MTEVTTPPARTPADLRWFDGDDDLRAATAAALLARWATLDAPAPGELEGEFDSALPVDRDAEVRRWFDDCGYGTWLGKAYTASTEAGRAAGTVGEGYNRWAPAAATTRHLRFAWALGPSTLDDRPALVMRYAAHRNAAGRLALVDEIRRVRPGLYVGAYHTATSVVPFTRTLAADGTRTDPEVFLLAGPVSPWVGPDDPDAEPAF